MITFIILSIMTVFILAIALGVFSIGGTIFTVMAADLIVAVFILWLIFKLFKKKKN